MTTKEKVEVMQAFLDGKQIQTRTNLLKNSLFISDWVDMDVDPSWSWGIIDYRIKPEPKKPTYRPYEDTEEMIADFKERFKVDVPPYAMPLIWVNHKESKLICIITDYGGNYVALGDISYNLELLLEKYTYLDGSPVGKLVEESRQTDGNN